MPNLLGGARRGRRPAAGNQDLFRTSRRLLAPVGALSILLLSTAHAAKWEIVPSITVGETYSDNIALTSDATKRSDWVSQVTPGLTVAGTGADLRFNASYTPYYNYYARGSGNDDFFQRGHALGNLQLADHLLFLDFGGSIDQYDVLLGGPLTTSTVNTTGNRATVGTYFASPYLRHDFGSQMQLEVRLTESVVDTDGVESLPDSRSDHVELHAKNGPAYKLFTWNVDYSRENIDYRGDQDNSVIETTTATGKRLVTSSLGLIAQAGYETYTMGEFLPDSKGAMWSAGFEWIPSPVTRLKATAGHRFYGAAYLLEFSHRTRLTTWGIDYHEIVTTSRSEFLVTAGTTTSSYLDTLFSAQFPDPAARKRAVDEFIARTGLPPTLGSETNFLNSQLFLTKRLQASTGWLGSKNVVLLNVFRENRETLIGNEVVQFAGDFSNNSSIVQTGVGGQWNFRLSQRDSWNTGASYSRNDFTGTTRRDTLFYLGMGLTRQFQPKLYGSVNYRRQQNDSNEDGFDYTENAVFANITMRF
ncbi:MAG TPA: TIGR03016 family PEP-CTERM system-associated outer membrane protein [Burkholderiales bacterium]|nr:TIGR03016 family PEP-CTERM system-associated outer membrane protein [Burkholderiales bacterium]